MKNRKIENLRLILTQKLNPLMLIFVFTMFSQNLISQTFVEVTNTPFPGIYNSSSAFGDVDNDGDLDLIISGRIGPSGKNTISKLYTNDGTGVFTVQIAPFAGAHSGDAKFADIDADNDLDVIIAGNNGSYTGQTILYTNDGKGNFTEITGYPLMPNCLASNIPQGLRWGKLAFGDIDGDNDLDIVTAGNDECQIVGAAVGLYTNDGNGAYTEVISTNTSLQGTQIGSLDFADVNGDNKEDILITGSLKATLYINNGSNSPKATNPFTGVEVSNAEFADIDNDGDQDVLITGQNSNKNLIADLYTNDGAGNFTLVSGTSITGLAVASIKFEDIDNDNDLDLFLTGSKNASISSKSQVPNTKIYTNNGSGVFTLLTGLPFDDFAQGSISIADIDNDGDKDVLFTGSGKAKLYKNEKSTGIQKEKLLEFNIYPNPTNGLINIKGGNEELTNTIIDVTSIDGELIKSMKLERQMNLEFLDKGIYFLRIYNNNNLIQTHKLII